MAARLRGEGEDPLADEAVAAYRVTPATVEEVRVMAERALDIVPKAEAVRAGEVDLPALLLERIGAAGRDGVEQDELVALAAAKGCPRVEVEEALASLLGEGECYMPRRGLIRRA
jgi:DNA replicative helicase MCM subunit Mcm2 (Cdc46/Mcm family)